MSCQSAEVDLMRVTTYVLHCYISSCVGQVVAVKFVILAPIVCQPFQHWRLILGSDTSSADPPAETTVCLQEFLCKIQ